MLVASRRRENLFHLTRLPSSEVNALVAEATADLMVGDVISAVDSRDTGSMSQAGFADAMRRPDGTVVHLLVVRDGAALCVSLGEPMSARRSSALPTTVAPPINDPFYNANALEGWKKSS